MKMLRLIFVAASMVIFSHAAFAQGGPPHSRRHTKWTTAALIAVLFVGLFALITVAAYANTDGTVQSSSKITAFQGGLGHSGFMGSSVAVIGDIDGNGVPDIASGGTWNNGEVDTGAVYIFLMNADGTYTGYVKIANGSGGLPLGSIPTGTLFGISIAAIGDVNGDGVPDLAVGAYGHDGGGGTSGNSGAVYILFMKTDGTVLAHHVIGQGTGGMPASTLDSGDWFGVSIAALGDIDGDNVPDMAVGAYRDDGDAIPTPLAGAVYIIKLNTDASVKAFHKINNESGLLPGTLASGASFGASVAVIGDLDKDGVQDLAVGAFDDTGAADAGAVYILFMNPGATVKGFQKIANGVGGLPAGTNLTGDAFGQSVVGIGDANGDSIIDIAVGAHGVDETTINTGAVYVLFLDTSGMVQSLQKIANGVGGLPLGTNDGNDYFGFSLAAIDLDADGMAELLVGSFADDTNGTTNTGSVHILFFNPTTQTLACQGFFSPFDKEIVIKLRSKRAIPVKMKLFDSEGFMLTDENISAPPVINVIFNGTTYGDSIANDEELLPLGNANEDNIFRYDPDSMQWVYNLGTKLFEASGEYIVKTVSGNQNEYVINTDGYVCSGTFERLAN